MGHSLAHQPGTAGTWIQLVCVCMCMCMREQARVEKVCSGNIETEIASAEEQYENVSPVPVQMWQGEPSPGAEVAGVMGHVAGCRCEQGRGQSRRRCGGSGGRFIL